MKLTCLWNVSRTLFTAPIESVLILFSVQMAASCLVRSGNYRKERYDKKLNIICKPAVYKDVHIYKIVSKRGASHACTEVMLRCTQ